MSDFGHVVNPAEIQKGNRIATKSVLDGFHPSGLEIHKILKSREVKKVEICPGKPEMIHLDGECYDTRFSTVVLCH